jgi:hypothetical protein
MLESLGLSNTGESSIASNSESLGSMRTLLSISAGIELGRDTVIVVMDGCSFDFRIYDRELRLGG